MQPDNRHDDEDAWRAIVENYGERVLADEDDAPEAEAHEQDPEQEQYGEPLDEPRKQPASHEAEDRFVPPPPPPLPRPTTDRLLAWLGVLGSPVVLLACVLAGISLPPLLAYGLVAAFVAGFVYLVVRMPRGPQDPWDDGARV